MRYPEDVIFAAGMAIPSPSTPIAVQYDLLLVTFVFRRSDGIILDAQTNMICSVSNEYLRPMLIGRCIYTDAADILKQIEARYISSIRPALMVCIKDAYNKICERGSGLPVLHKKEETVKVPVDKSVSTGYTVHEIEPEDGGTAKMNELPSTAVCVVGLSKTGSRNPITKVHQSLVGSLVVDSVSGEIYAAEFNTVCSLTNQFISDMLIGRNLCSDLPEMIRQIQDRYLGDSRKAIISVLKDAHNKLMIYMDAQNTDHTI